MIDEKSAREVAGRYLRAEVIELLEFEHGWWVTRPNAPKGARDITIVERSTGKLLMFGTGIPPRTIEESFDEIRPRARELPEVRPDGAGPG